MYPATPHGVESLPTYEPWQVAFTGDGGSIVMPSSLMM